VLKPLKICIDYKLAILLLMEIDAFSKHSQQTTGALFLDTYTRFMSRSYRRGGGVQKKPR
jgi:hypothetical protein